MRISFLLHYGYGIGGTIRTVFTLARMLAEQHEVEIVSVFRHRDEPVFDLPPGVTLRPLLDLRAGGADHGHPDLDRPSRLFPRGESRRGQYSALTDRRIAGWLRGADTDAVIGTRPGLNVHIARDARPGVVRVAQEHATFLSHPWPLKLALSAHYPLMDAVVTVTEADAAVYARRLRLPGVWLGAIPNAVPAPQLPPADGSSRIVIAAGRLAWVKRYDRMLRVFERVVRVRPDWQLRLYGDGPWRDRLHVQIEKLGLYNHVHLMGAAHPLDAEWVKGSVSLSTAQLESFGLSIAESMRCGLPVVAADCPYGPGEIITDGEDGLLARNGDLDGLAARLLRLVEDDDLRVRMGRRAVENVARFDPERIAGRYDALLTGLRARRHGRLVGPALGGVYAATMAGRRLRAWTP
ncbi:Glycosyltransferase Gtf1 [Streptomyces sp. RB5]|uniref:D-inositol 3-phosphate glycosyltransferase n=1 Tax=Streptomyces smaragdinus TaxID=2585196 RepID=A0A7K0CI70_9ACTN|nr:glycosyltransferase [Streptomyces smaragdinus]MQY13167.1 Glycosyltransferase Gtf1 [Streptomyces smaragdinus]